MLHYISNLWYFSTSKNHLHSLDQSIKLNLVDMQSFMTISCKPMNIWDPKLANFCKEMYARGQALPAGIHFFVTIVKFGVPYIHEFAMDSYQTSHNMY